MFLRQLDLTTALRPSLYEDESLLFVQDAVGLYEGKFKIPNYQNGHAYLTSHRICYVDNEEPRKYSVAVDLKDVDRTEFYAGFLKSSAKITIFPKASKQATQGLRSPVPRYATPADALLSAPGSPSRSYAPSPAPARDINATWICPICAFSNPVPPNFDPNTASQYTTLPPCKACGIPPPLVHLVKAAIAAMSNRTAGSATDALAQSRPTNGSDNGTTNGQPAKSTSSNGKASICPRCTFENHPSLTTCEICGASLTTTPNRLTHLMQDSVQRPESPGPTLNHSIVGDDTIETIKLSFRAGGDKMFLERLKGALVQRKWLLQSAPPVPRPNATPNGDLAHFDRTGQIGSQPAPARVVGIAGLEQRGAQLRENNQTVIGAAFEDLEALMTSAKEVIAMAEQFRAQSQTGTEGMSAETRNMLSDSASALGLTTTKDMLGTGSASETLYLNELSRNLAEFLTDDRRGVLRREGGIISLVDLWAVFNRTRNGIELVSPLDFERAASMWDTLRLPVRLRRFRSGLLVVQERSRTDERTISGMLTWLREPQYAFPVEADPLAQSFGRGVTAQETAEKFGWSVGVATEELELAEETGALCRDQCLDGIRFWENHFQRFDEPKDAAQTLRMIGELSV